MAIPSDIGGTTWLNSTESYDGGELRRADGAEAAGAAGTPWGGIARHSDTAMAVTVDASDVVTVNPGAAVVPGNAVSQTGVYRVSLATAITGALAARNATNPRITLVVFRALDTDVVPGHAAYKGRIEFVNGTPGAVPSAPALPTMAVELARITVPQTGGGVATVDSTYRTFAVSAGGELIVPTFARLPAAACKYQRARALDTGLEYTWDSTAWVRNGTWLTHTPAVSAQSGPFTSASGTTRYMVDGRTLYYSTSVVVVTAGAVTGSVRFGLPLAAQTTGTSTHIGTGRESQLTGKALVVQRNGASLADIFGYDNAAIIANGTTFAVSGFYELA